MVKNLTASHGTAHECCSATHEANLAHQVEHFINLSPVCIESGKGRQNSKGDRENPLVLLFLFLVILVQPAGGIIFL